jgi:putative transposase
MHEWESLSHVRWECKYHVVIIPKYRKKSLYGKLKKRIGRILRELCEQRGVELLEGKAMADHVHMCVSIPPKYSVAHTVGFLKGKSAVRIHRELLQERRMTGLHFWATGDLRPGLTGAHHGSLAAFRETERCSSSRQTRLRSRAAAERVRWRCLSRRDSSIRRSKIRRTVSASRVGGRSSQSRLRSLVSRSGS